MSSVIICHVWKVSKKAGSLHRKRMFRGFCFWVCAFMLGGIGYDSLDLSRCDNAALDILDYCGATFEMVFDWTPTQKPLGPAPECLPLYPTSTSITNESFQCNQGPSLTYPGMPNYYSTDQLSQLPTPNSGMRFKWIHPYTATISDWNLLQICQLLNVQWEWRSRASYITSPLSILNSHVRLHFVTMIRAFLVFTLSIAAFLYESFPWCHIT